MARKRPPTDIIPVFFDYFCNMKRLSVLLLLAVLGLSRAGAYNDHRGHNLDSLERVVARWTPDALDRASNEELVKLNRACRNLMLGYHVMNGEKCVFYARKALSISHPRGWNAADADAYRYIGQNFYVHEQYDSAMVYYRLSLASVDRMASGAVSATDPDGYDERTIDDYYSALYGSIGNLYNMMESIPQAMDYYEKAGAIFEKYGWNESNSILHYNMGETWIDEGDLKKARAEYDKAMAFAEASGDSLMIVDAWKGYGRLYMEQGRTWKSLKFLRKADAYYAAHPDFSPTFRTENLNYMQEVLSRQKRHLGLLTGLLAGLALVAAGFGIALRRRRGTPAEPSAKAVSADAPELSEREREILDLMAKGYTTAQIADGLSLSPETIRWYRKKLLEKFDVANTPELIARVMSMGSEQ